MSDLDLTLLPWMRRGASRNLVPPSDGRFGVGSSLVQLTINGQTSAAVPVTMMGPGHVLGLDSRQVIRTDPVAGSPNFEPNFFPLVEFDEPALPWLFTPVPAGAEQDQLAPWLCLVVVRRQQGVSLEPASGRPLPRLIIQPPAVPREELPDLKDSWAWAHAQVVSGDAVERDLDKLRPEQSLSRLICPRVLQPDADYIACVVPTFELGRLAGLGKEVTAEHEARLEPAWQFPEAPVSGEPAAGAEIELPVYYSWEFRTSPGGDFRSLAMLLHVLTPVPDKLGTKSIDISKSGLEGAVPDQTIAVMSGALRPQGAGAETWRDDATRVQWENKLKAVINAPAAVPADKDPLLAPPLYGSAQAGIAATADASPTRWFEQLNLSPVHRTTAQLGTRVVKAHQDALVASAWEQAAELEKANRLLRQQQLAASLSTSLFRRHLEKMDPATGLQVLAPARERIIQFQSRESGTADLRPLLQNTGLAPASYANSVRRVARPRGAVFRRAGTRPDPGEPYAKPRSILAALQPAVGTARMVAVPAGGGALTFGAVGASLNPPRHDVGWGEATFESVQSAPAAPAFAFMPPGQPVPVAKPGHGHPHFPPHHPPHHPPPHFPHLGPHHGPGHLGPHGIPGDLPDEPEVEMPVDWDPGPAPSDSTAAALFRGLAKDHLAVFSPTPPPPPPVPPGPPPPPADADALLAAFRSATSEIRPRLVFAIKVKALVEIDDPGRTDEDLLEPVHLSPHFPQPMVEQLAELSQDLVLPGLEKVPPNSVLGLVTNPAFVEAFMVGLNHEMGRELLWRGYPVNMHATYFDRFWTSPFPVFRDIEPIDSWGDRSLTLDPGEGKFVMLIRSELLQRYPNAFISATKGQEERYPIFAGGFAPDVRYVGFDIPALEANQWRVVIKESPSAPRFGLRSDEHASGHIAARDVDAALTANDVRMRPVRITLALEMPSEVPS